MRCVPDCRGTGTGGIGPLFDARAYGPLKGSAGLPALLDT